MALSLEKVSRAHTLLKEYKGSNSHIISLKNKVFVYKSKSMNDFDCEYVLRNHDKEPFEVKKLVKVGRWYQEELKGILGVEFIPEKLMITWFMGETSTMYHIYAIYRRSQEKAVSLFIPKKAILTDFLSEEWNLKEIDFKPYNEKSGRTLYPHQEDAVKFLTSRKKAILADVMGFGKTTSAIVSALEGQYKKVLIVCPASMKVTWKNELSAYVDENDITIVEGSNWKENRFTIINYDILKNFYEVPTETVKEKRLSTDDNGNVINVVKEKETISRKSSVINEAMENSQLFQSNFDLMIIDEAHRLSNNSSGIFKIMSDLVKRSDPSGIYLLSGTIITNKPINLYNMLKLINHPIASDWKFYVEHYCDGQSFYNRKERDAHTAIFCKSVGKASWYDLTQDEKNKLDEVLERRCKKIWKTDGASNLDELQEIIKPCYLRRDKDDLVLKKKTIKTLTYELTDSEREEYDKVWDDYVSKKKEIGNAEKYKAITEGIVFRQWLANSMVPRTIELVKKCIEKGNKVVVFCSFDEELNAIKEEFKDICVVHNGKMTPKKKTESVERFQNDDNVKIFIGNIQSAGVGLTLVSSRIVVFNSITFVPGDMLQAEDRVHRLNQTKDCMIYYQLFNDTYMGHMFDVVHKKSEIIDNIIISEKQK